MLLLLGKLKKMNGTIFPSDNCYLPIHEDTEKYALRRFTKIWTNFIWHNASDLTSSSDALVEWNGRLINDVIVFDSEQDKMWFILRWS